MIRSILLTADGSLLRFYSSAAERWRDNPGSVLWLDLENEDPHAEEKLLLDLNINPMAISDAQRKRHPPKVEEFDHYTFMLYRGFQQFDEDLRIDHIQVAFFVGTHFLITRRDGNSIGIQSVWDQNNELTTYLKKPALLMMRILRASMNGYLGGLLEMEDKLSQIEDDMLTRPTDTMMHKLVMYRSRLRKLNRVFSYHERIVRQIIKEPTAELNGEDVALYHALQDVYDKCERLHSLGTLFYDQCGDLVEGYLSLTSHQLNKTMQALTVITAIFVPLGLLSGIYGMNFDNMPELHSENGYFILIGVMLSVASTLLLLFRRKGWL